MKILTVAGARPQFIKVAAVSRILRTKATEVLVHTGQHYDANMSDIFFEELDIPYPNYNLGISGGTHGHMTGAMLSAIENILIIEKPDVLLVYGDTNSTLAAALAAVKLQIPVCHVEAGNRLGTFSNPEEINRICTDHVATLLLSCTQSGMDFLKKENLGSRSKLVGDPMYDAFIYYGEKLANRAVCDLVDFSGKKIDIPEMYYYLTCHREENTKNDEALKEIFIAMNSLDALTIYPVHPRNKERAERLCYENNFKNIILAQPVGYLTSIYLIKHAKKVVSDSGGVQREAFFAKKPSVTIFDYIGWPETMVNNCNILSKANATEILEKLSINPCFDDDYKPFGDGHASEKIVKELLKM
ncbi:MAG: UDP-N-acetylglucosamine 2-epimerase (non-hydrolyzing) [Clostridiales bacterium]